MKPLLAICLLLSGCSVNPITGNPFSVPIPSGMPPMMNGCLPEAIECCRDLKGSKAEAQVVLVSYTVGSRIYGHAMATYYWPPRPSPYAVRYAYDRTNASTALPKNTVTAEQVAKYMLPSEVYATFSGPVVN